jgi:hypothetical protein
LLHKVCFYFLNLCSKSNENEAAAIKVVAGKEFVFGEQLIDRVINAPPETAEGNSNGETTSTSTEKNNASSNADGGSANENDTGVKSKSSNSGTVWPASSEKNSVDYEKYLAENENDTNTIVKFNCKLFMLDTVDKTNWIERGYGLLKLIDDGKSCKMSNYERFNKNYININV